MTYERLELERTGPEGSILHVWMNRPESLNALDTTALEEIAACFGALQEDFRTRVVVLGGRGASFCAGADRKSPPGAERMLAASGASERERRYASQLGRRAAHAILESEVATLARVQGHAVGGGFLLALCCDFRVASEDASFHVPEVDLGVPLSWGGTPRLLQEVGAARGREILLLCDRIDAATAERWGIAHRVVAADALDAEVEAWATRLAAKPEIAVHMTKTQLRAYARMGGLGDVSETDGDALMAASRVGVARESFRTR